MSSFTPINRRASEDDTCRQTTSSEGRTTTYQQLPHDENTTQEQLPQDEDTTYRQSPRDDKISPTASSGPTSRGWTLPPRGGTQRRGDSNVSQRDTAAVSRSEDSKLTQCRSASKSARNSALWRQKQKEKLKKLETCTENQAVRIQDLEKKVLDLEEIIKSNKLTIESCNEPSDDERKTSSTTQSSQ